MPDLVEYLDVKRRRCPSEVRSRRHDYTDYQDWLREEQQSGSMSAAPPQVLPALVANVLKIADADEPDDAIALIYREVDALLREGAFARVAEILDAIDANALPVVHLLAFVSITRAAKAHVSSRAGFVARIREHIAAVDPDRVEELLAGLE